MPKFHGEKAGAKSRPAKVIRYVLNEEKTLAYDTVGLNGEEPYSKQFMQTAALHDSDYGFDERKYYHYKMTFEEKDWDKNGGEITPEIALDMGKKLCDKHFPGHEAVLSVHGDTKNIHVHIVLNAYSYNQEQNKIHISDNDYRELKDYAFELGQEYGLDENFWRDEVAAKRSRQQQELERDAGAEQVRYAGDEKYIEEKHGKNFADYSFKEQYRLAIDEAKLETGSREGLQMYLKEHFDIDTKITEQGNIKYKLPDRKTYTSGKALGNLYELPAIDAALAQNQNRLENEIQTEMKKEKEYSPTPTLVEQEAADFYQSFEKFKEWKDGEYQQLREEWLQETDRKAAYMKEYYLNKSVLENGQLAFYANIEKLTNEMRSKAETDAYQKEMEALKEQSEEIQKQQTSFLAFGSESEETQKQSSPSERDEQRQAYVESLMAVGNSLDEKIRAAEGLREMNIEDQKGKSLEDKAFEHYGRDTRTFDVTEDKLKPENDWRQNKIRAMYDSIRLARETGANTAAEFKLVVNQKGAELGALRKELRAAEKDGNPENIEHLSKQVEKTKNEYARYARALKEKEIFEEKYIRLGGPEGLQRDIDRQTVQQLEKRIPYLEKQQEFLTRQAKTLNSICSNMHLSLSDVLTNSERAEQYDDFVSRRNNAYDRLNDTRREIEEAKKRLEELYKKAEKELSPAPSEQRRTKEQAIKEKNGQNAELREWIDEAREKIGAMPEQNRDADMQMFVEEMQKHGCTVRITENTISVKHPNSNQPIRTNRLGEDYSKGAIENVISAQRKERANEHDRTNTQARSIGRERSRER